MQPCEHSIYTTNNVILNSDKTTCIFLTLDPAEYNTRRNIHTNPKIVGISLSFGSLITNTL